jgi:hypothetical protein
LAVCIGLNELCRRNKWFSLAMFLVLPGILTFTVWPHTAGAGSSMGTWFYWVKVYSVLAGCLGFMAIRFLPGVAKNKWALFFPALILALNICEAVVRDFQVYTFHATGQLINGMGMRSGPWNIMNGVAGILNILAISGWALSRIKDGHIYTMTMKYGLPCDTIQNPIRKERNCGVGVQPSRPIRNIRQRRVVLLL